MKPCGELLNMGMLRSSAYCLPRVRMCTPEKMKPCGELLNMGMLRSSAYCLPRVRMYTPEKMKPCGELLNMGMLRSSAYCSSTARMCSRKRKRRSEGPRKRLLQNCNVRKKIYIILSSPAERLFQFLLLGM